MHEARSTTRAMDGGLGAVEGAAAAERERPTAPKRPAHSCICCHRLALCECNGNTHRRSWGRPGWSPSWVRVRGGVLCPVDVQLHLFVRCFWASSSACLLLLRAWTGSVAPCGGLRPECSQRVAGPAGWCSGFGSAGSYLAANCSVRRTVLVHHASSPSCHPASHRPVQE